MITGGSNGAGSSGNIRSGYSDVFLPARVHLLEAAAVSTYNSGNTFDLSAYVRIKNASDEWVTISDASYFQINHSPDGNTDTCNITVQDPSTWSIYGTEYPDLLRPSNRAIEILARIEDFDYQPIFIGRISAYSRPEGANGGAINLTCGDVRTILQRESAETFTGYEQTTYHDVKKQLLEKTRALGIGFSAQMPDSSGLILASASKFDQVNTSVPNAKWYATSTGNLIIGSGDYEQIIGADDIIQLTDGNIHQAARSLDDGQGFNTVTIGGLVDGTYTTDTETDAADVLLRGSVFYSGGIIGTQTATLEESRAVAVKMIAESLAGTFNIVVPFFPYFDVGQIVYVQSDRFAIAPSYAVLNRVRHQYQVGNAATYLDRITLTEI